MGSFLTSKQTQTQTIDPTLERESRSLMSLFRMLAGMEPQPNRNVTVADFTPQQKAAMDGTQAAAGAFGMPTAVGGPSAGMPNATASGNGIMGFSSAPEVDRSKALLPSETKAQLAAFRNAASTPTRHQKMKSGGKK